VIRTPFWCFRVTSCNVFGSRSRPSLHPHSQSVPRSAARPALACALASILSRTRVPNRLLLYRVHADRLVVAALFYSPCSSLSNGPLYCTRCLANSAVMHSSWRIRRSAAVSSNSLLVAPLFYSPAWSCILGSRCLAIGGVRDAHEAHTPRVRLSPGASVYRTLSILTTPTHVQLLPLTSVQQDARKSASTDGQDSGQCRRPHFISPIGGADHRGRDFASPPEPNPSSHSAFPQFLDDCGSPASGIGSRCKRVRLTSRGAGESCRLQQERTPSFTSNDQKGFLSHDFIRQARANICHLHDGIGRRTFRHGGTTGSLSGLRPSIHVRRNREGVDDAPLRVCACGLCGQILRGDPCVSGWQPGRSAIWPDRGLDAAPSSNSASANAAADSSHSKSISAGRVVPVEDRLSLGLLVSVERYPDTVRIVFFRTRVMFSHRRFRRAGS